MKNKKYTSRQFYRKLSGRMCKKSFRQMYKILINTGETYYFDSMMSKKFRTCAITNSGNVIHFYYTELFPRGRFNTHECYYESRIHEFYTFIFSKAICNEKENNG